MPSITDETDAQRIARQVAETGVATLDRGAPAMVSTDAMIAAARYVSREWGDYGYTIGAVAGMSGHGLFRVRHFDGSTFYITADKWGNVATVADAN